MRKLIAAAVLAAGLVTGCGTVHTVHCQREYGGQVGHAFHWRTICQ